MKVLVALHWDEKFFGSTRGQIVTLLRRSGRTVDELARELALTNNGIRAHLATLERDGLVRQRGVVRHRSGGGKPAYVYELTSEAEGLFPKAYEPVLRQLLEVLKERGGSAESEALLREAGERMAAGMGDHSDDIRERLEGALAAFGKLGGTAELETRDGKLAIRSYGCPVSALVPEHPEVCRLAETFISTVAGVPVHARCERGENPRCCFEVEPPSNGRTL